MNLSFRVIVDRYKHEDQFLQLLDFLAEHKEAIDEIALFTEFWHHGYYPLDAFEELCQILDNRITRIRELGFESVGINILCTLGHLEEAWDWLPKLPYQAVMAPDGTLSKSSFCPNSPEFRTYISQKYALTARANPDFIWVDDDIRMHHLGIAFACFCPTCIQIYNTKHTTQFSREQLVAELNSVEGMKSRENWVEQNITTIEVLLSLIAETVHGINDRIELGLMTTGIAWTTYSGADFTRWMKALRATKARPGGGFYDDSQPFGFVTKMHEVNRQIAHYPDFVKDIQYELENFPFQRLSKSVHITTLECTAAIMSGVNGIAFDALKQEKGTLAEYHALMRGIQNCKKLWSEMDRIAGSFKNAGLYPALSLSFEARRTVSNGNWFEIPTDDSTIRSYILSEIGIPLTMNESAASGTILTGNLPEGFTDAELKQILSRGVLLDGRALELIIARGFGALCGVAIEQTYDNGVYECLTNDALNGGYQGECRDARISMWKGLAYVLKQLHEDVRILSTLTSYSNVELGPTSSVYENELGGRIAVQGYLPWQKINTAVKRTQFMQISDWISYGRLPIVIERSLKVVPFLKAADDGGKWLLMLLNASFDETEEFTAKVRYPADNGKLYELFADGSSVLLQDSEYQLGDGEIIITVNNIGSWKSRMFYQA